MSEQFGRWTALAKAKTETGRAAWLCRCACGAERIVRADQLESGTSTSCGCKRSDSTFVHGMTGTRELHHWSTIKQRCCNPADKDYPRYGGRGIRMCEQWLESFARFYADVGTRPAGASLDRIDNDGNYEPGNVRWATCRQQSRNRTSSRLNESNVLEIHGRYEHGESSTSIAVRFGVSRSTVGDIRSGRTWSDIR